MGVLLDSIKLVSSNRADRLVDYKRLQHYSYTKLQSQGIRHDNKDNSAYWSEQSGQEQY